VKTFPGLFSAREDKRRSAATRVLICVGLAALTVLVYWPVLNAEFINYDDPDYVTDNEQVTGGLSWGGIVWAFSTVHAANWHPATWLSHMLDAQLFGLNPARHHLINLMLHAANSILLFLMLERHTRARWRSAMVAGLFALHPMHVESVAWIAERKDVLSALFFMLTVWAYAEYAKKFEIGDSKLETNSKFETRSDPAEGAVAAAQSPRLQQRVFYLIALMLFALGLMAKPMLVTLPFVLLLLDWWPLNRLPSSNFTTLVREEIPFMALSAGSCVVTFIVQRKAGAVASIEHATFGSRLSNAAVSYARYIEKLLWPQHLALPYVERTSEPALIGGAVLFLVIVSVVVCRLAARNPSLFVGWFWFVGMLVPVIGFVQVGSQTMADRYSYLPSIGLFICLTWVVGEWACRDGVTGAHGAELHLRGGRAGVRLGLAGAGVVLLALCAYRSRVQAGYWRNSELLFGHTLKVTSRNYVAHDQLGEIFATRGESGKARA
jgi:hypothetical protein